MPSIKFTAHAIKRAHERKLASFLNKELFWFDGEFLDNNRVRVRECIYAFERKGNGSIKVVTMYNYENLYHL
jgi:hypothetical protein